MFLVQDKIWEGGKAMEVLFGTGRALRKRRPAREKITFDGKKATTAAFRERSVDATVKLQPGLSLLIVNEEGKPVATLLIGAGEPFGSNPQVINLTLPEGYLVSVDRQAFEEIAIRPRRYRRSGGAEGAF